MTPGSSTQTQAGEPKIYLVDVTNRDGVQTSRLGLAKLEKTLINIYLNRMGVYRSEFGFPFARHEVNYLNANLQLAQKGVLQPIKLSGWCTVRLRDVKQSFQFVPKLRHINISVSTSRQMIKGKFGQDKDEDYVINMMLEALKYCKEHGVGTVGVNAEDASRSDMDFLLRYAGAARDNGADTIRYCDTLGYDDPFTIYERCKLLAQEVKLPLEIHCHNDLGLSVANSLAAV